MLAGTLVSATMSPPEEFLPLSRTPGWKRRDRRLKIGTIATGSATAVAILGVLAAAGVMVWAREHGDIARGEGAGLAMIGVGEVAAVSFAAMVGFGGALQLHRERATDRAAALRRITPLERAEGSYDARRDPAWVTRDQTLTGWMLGAGVLAMMSTIPTAIFLADRTSGGWCGASDCESPRRLWISTAMLAGAGFVGLAVAGGLRHRHRAPLRKWQLRPGAGGLVIRF